MHSEYATGLAVFTKLEELKQLFHLRARGIPVKISTEFFKKSRGTMTATCKLVDFPTKPGVYKDFQVCVVPFHGHYR